MVGLIINCMIRWLLHENSTFMNDGKNQIMNRSFSSGTQKLVFDKNFLVHKLLFILNSEQHSIPRTRSTAE